MILRKCSRRSLRKLEAWFDVHEHIMHRRHFLADAIFDVVGYLVGLAHGQLRIDFNVHVNKIFKAGLARDALFDSLHSSHVAGHGPDVRNQRGVRRGVHEFIQSRA